MAMLQGEERLTLELLNRATHAWVEQEYHRAVHSEIGTTPLQRFLDGPHVGRDCPSSDAVRTAFRIQVSRKQASIRWHRAYRRPALRDPQPLSPHRNGVPAVRALGSQPHRSGGPPGRYGPVPDLPARSLGQQRRAASPAR